MRPLGELLPEVVTLLDDLDDGIAGGDIADLDEFTAACRRRWDDDLIARVDAVLPRWSKMASFLDGTTLFHVTEAMVALRRLDEYEAADDHLRDLFEWTVLLHDIAKEPAPLHRQEHRHAFRSAAVAARYLPRLGFEVTEAYARDFEAWFQLADNAHVHDDKLGQPVQDNRLLGEVLGGADRLLAGDGARVVKAIALHLSVTGVSDWPSPAPMTPTEERTYLTPEVAEILLPLMLADTGGWNLFEPDTLVAMYREIRAVFDRIETQHD